MLLAVALLARLAQVLAAVLSTLEGILWLTKATVNILLRGESRCDGFCPSNQKLTPEGLQPISTFPLIRF